jgi:hypothetical protein
MTEYTYPVVLSGACKLHGHDSCGYSKCECICHDSIPISKIEEKIKKLRITSWGEGDRDKIIDEFESLLPIKEDLNKERNM